MYFHSACFSNYEALICDPTQIGPSAQIWRASGITSELQLYCTAIGALVFAALMLFAGLDPVIGGLWLTEIAHHHLAIAILFLIAGHMYRTKWGIGHGLKDILEAHKGPFIAHHMYSMPPYPYLATDYGTQLSLFTNHMSIGGFLIVGASALEAFFMLDVWGSVSDQGVVTHITRGNFVQSCITINGWLHDFLWAQASQWWYTIGLRINEDIYTGSLFLLFLSAISLIAGLFGVRSLAWTGHLVHVAIPAS
ncbi:hypothetical protein HAX54_030991, partial [Datura stramonium]|nr:hypothetical protein [Datura stramonium]